MVVLETQISVPISKINSTVSICMQKFGVRKVRRCVYFEISTLKEREKRRQGLSGNMTQGVSGQEITLSQYDIANAMAYSVVLYYT